MKPSCRSLAQADALEDGRLSTEEQAAFERHCRACEQCRERVASGKRLRELGFRLAIPVDTDLRLRRLRGRILQGAREALPLPNLPKNGVARSARAAVALAAVATLFVAVLVAVLVHRQRPAAVASSSAFAGWVTATNDSKWGQTRSGKIERVVLAEGEVSIVVRKQEPDERFFVDLPDGELEVRGTTFSVVARRNRTERVHVVEGEVWIRIRGEELALVAGQTWPVEAPVSEAPRGAPPAAAPPPPGPVRAMAGGAASQSPSQSPSQSLSQSLSQHKKWRSDYEDAVDLYRAGRFAEGAEAFRRFSVEHASSELLEDATFLEALCLAKAGDTDAAAAAARRHLARFPGSFHGKDAAILVARALREHGECDGARRALAPWLDGPSADRTVIAALGSCRLP